MHAELQTSGLAMGRHRVARLMSENGLKARQKTRFKKTTDSNHGGPVAPNVLDQNFTAQGPDEKWGVDISYVWTAEGWLYLAIVLDLYSRKIVGWSISDRMKRGVVLKARLAYSLGPESKEARVDPRETAIPRGSGGRDRARHGEHRAGAWSVRPSVHVLNR